MRLNSLGPAPGSTKARKRVGRGIGSGSGKTCGTGHKGQKSRSGGSISPGFEGGQMPLHMRLPKYGFSSRIGRVTAEIRTSELNKVDAEVIDIAALRKANLISSNISRVKVMLSGDITKAVTLQGIRVTKGARSAIEAAGGKIEEAVQKPVAEKPAKKQAKANTEPVEKSEAQETQDTNKADKANKDSSDES